MAQEKLSQQEYNEMRSRAIQLIHAYEQAPRAFPPEKVAQLQALATEFDIPMKLDKVGFGEKLAKGTVAMGYNALDTMLFDVLPDEWGPETTGGFDDSMKSFGGLLGLLASVAAGPIAVAKGIPKLIGKLAPKARAFNAGVGSTTSATTEAAAASAGAEKLKNISKLRELDYQKRLMQRAQGTTTTATEATTATTANEAGFIKKFMETLKGLNAQDKKIALKRFFYSNPELFEKIAASKLSPYIMGAPVANQLFNWGGELGEGIGGAFDSEYPEPEGEATLMNAMQNKGY